MTSTTTLPPVGQPLHGASFGQAVKRFFQGYVKFAGRASRSEFWWALLFTFLVALVASIPYAIALAALVTRAATTQGEPVDDPAVAQELAGLTGGMLLGIGLLVVVSLALALPSYAVMWRRLQDANFHGAFALLSIVGFGIVPLVMCVMPSNPAGVQYDPAYRASGYGGYPAQPHGAQPYGGQPYGRQPYGGEQYGGQQYGEQPYGGQQYGGQQHGGQPYGGEPPEGDPQQR